MCPEKCAGISQQRERAPCGARTACWYGSSVGVKRVYRSERKEERMIEKREKETGGPGARKPETERASQSDHPASRARERREDDADDESPTGSEHKRYQDPVPRYAGVMSPAVYFDSTRVQRRSIRMMTNVESLHGRLRFREIKYVRWFVLLYSKLLHRVHELQLSTVGSHQVAHM
ncbi:uncharacterized protein LOC105664362 isoform X2 [Megachile rotundata]|uniref:uncharacterized protein LOC105664362 isoform X2 n=1 Tax=Megachile rotundata TaxID=143995 RepID=UPI003FCF07DF